MSKIVKVGVVLDHEQPGGYADFAWYALREQYFTAIAEAGAMPVAIPYCHKYVSDYIRTIDALLLPGGAFDIDPAIYGNQLISDTVKTKDGRTKFEIAMLREVMSVNMPFLGICAGEQLLNVVLGGTLIQHIPDEIDNALIHEQPKPKNIPWHDISITAGSLLNRITGLHRMKVNSTHHQAVKELAPSLRISAVADDGVVEAIEHPGMAFCLGVEWHPEYQESEGDRAIFSGLVDAAEEFKICRKK